MHFKNKKIFKAFKKLYSCNLKSIKINNMAVNVQRIVNKLRINRINKKIHLIEKWRNDKKYFVLVFIFFKKYLFLGFYSMKFYYGLSLNFIRKSRKNGLQIFRYFFIII